MKTKLLAVAALFILITSCSKKENDDDDTTLNPWDGRYRIEGTLTDHAEPAITWPGNTYEYSLETNSPTQVTLVSKNLGIPGHLISHGGSLSYYSQFSLVLTFDPATHKITGITNHYGQPSANGRSAVLDPSGANQWDPVTKNITIKYWMDETGVAGHKTSFNETWVYIGAR